MKNIALGESMGYLSKKMAAEMFAGELNITTYDYEEVEKDVEDDRAKNPTPPMLPPGGRFGMSVDPMQDGEVHGAGKADTKAKMNAL